MSCVMFMESAQTWGSRARGHRLGRGPTKRVPSPLVARVTRPERARGSTEVRIVPIIKVFLKYIPPCYDPAHTIKGCELSYMARALQCEQTTHRSLLMLAGRSWPTLSR